MDIKDRPAAELQAEYDSAVSKIHELQTLTDSLNAELSRRQNARTFVFNQVIDGHAEALLANGADPGLVAEAQAHVAAEKIRKAKLREERAVAAAGGAS